MAWPGIESRLKFAWFPAGKCGYSCVGVQAYMCVCVGKTYAHERTQAHAHTRIHANTYVLGHSHFYSILSRATPSDIELALSMYAARCALRPLMYASVCKRVWVCEGMLKFICQKDYHGNRVLSISEQTFAAFYGYAASVASFVMCGVPFICFCYPPLDLLFCFVYVCVTLTFCVFLWLIKKKMASNNYVRQFCNRLAFVRLQLAAAVRYVPRAMCATCRRAAVATFAKPLINWLQSKLS